MPEHQFVVIACGTSPHLKDCVLSVLDQTASGKNPILATSTPNEHIFRIASTHGLQVAVNPTPGLGIGADWNFALASGQAQFVTLAHQDDLYEREYRAELCSAMDRYPDTLIGFCDSVEVNLRGEEIRTVNNLVKRALTRRAFGQDESIQDPVRKRKLLAWGNPVCCPSVVFNLARLREFAFSERLSSNLDWDAWLRLAALDAPFVFVSKPLVKKRNHSLSATAALLADSRRAAEDREMFDRLWPRPAAALLARIYRLGYLANAKVT
jgi:hypothetical protein